DDEDGGVDTSAPDEYDTVFGDGADLANVDLPEDSALTDIEAQCISNFEAVLNAIKIETCSCCQEEGFHVKLKPSGMCSRCETDKRDIKMWSDQNNVNPMPEDDRPPCLKNLTEVEEMIIARVKSVMQVRWTRG
ncbi:hypothetical protein C8R43DRAFT_847231, partial [Mycena crocata]